MKVFTTSAIEVSLVALVPFIMHENSVMWHNAAPGIQAMLHKH